MIHWSVTPTFPGLTVPKGTTVLLECMSNLVANEMFQENGAHENTVKAVVDGVEFLQKQDRKSCDRNK